MFYKWFNMPEKWEVADDRIVIEADGKRDYFIDPITGEETNNAPYYAKNNYGNFTFHVSSSLNLISAMMLVLSYCIMA